MMEDEYDKIAKEFPKTIIAFPRLSFESQLAQFLRERKLK